MSAWRVAYSLDVLLAQNNAYAPSRSKISDGSIGDAAHASRDSDHNPWVHVPPPPPVVTARDFTHDPAHGFDCHVFAASLVESRDQRIKYIIWFDRIWQNGWAAYHGVNNHEHHCHVSVKANAICDDRAPWNLAMYGHGVVVPSPPVVVLVSSVTLDVTKLQLFAVHAFPAYARGLIADGVMGPKTIAFVKEFQRRSNLAPDGVVGTLTLNALRRNGYRG